MKIIHFLLLLLLSVPALATTNLPPAKIKLTAILPTATSAEIVAEARALKARLATFKEVWRLAYNRETAADADKTQQQRSDDVLELKRIWGAAFREQFKNSLVAFDAAYQNQLTPEERKAWKNYGAQYLIAVTRFSPDLVDDNLKIVLKKLAR